MVTLGSRELLGGEEVCYEHSLIFRAKIEQSWRYYLWKCSRDLVSSVNSGRSWRYRRRLHHSFLINRGQNLCREFRSPVIYHYGYEPLRLKILKLLGFCFKLK